MLEVIAQFVFWFACFSLFYAYLGYPGLVWAVSRLFPKSVLKSEYTPSVSVIITAYNEERDIREKLENTLLLDYDRDKLEILVASDGSTDGTDEIVREFKLRGVKLFRQEGRVGKTYTQNKAVEQVSGEIILFSDATTMYQPDVLLRIVPNFADKTIGCVAGKLIYVDPNETAVGKGAKSYWGYETFLKESESRACSLIGVSGCLYGVRKSAYVPMDADACSDFLIATKIYEQGLRTVYEPSAVCMEDTNLQSDKELKMRVRVISQTMNDLWKNRAMLNPFKSGFYAVELISHKIFRYAVPLFLALIFLSSGFLAVNSKFYGIIFGLQILFYAAASISLVFDRFGRKIKILALPQYFVLANAASVLAFRHFLKGNKFAAWEPIRASANSESGNPDNLQTSTKI